MVLFRDPEEETSFDLVVKPLLRGEYADQCLNKIRAMEGTVIAVDFTRGQWREGVGETLFFICKETPYLFATLRTDDSCVSFTAMGHREVDGVDRLAQMALDGIAPPALDRRVPDANALSFATENGLTGLKDDVVPSYYKSSLIVDIESGQGHYLYRLVVSLDDNAVATKIELLTSTTGGAKLVSTGKEALEQFKEFAETCKRPEKLAS